MDGGYVSSVFDRFRAHGIEVRPGLSAVEFRTVENRFGFRFPPDLRDFLSHGLPVGPEFPDWRNGPDEAIRDRLAAPLEGILFDVEHNHFWMPGWGPRPGSMAEAVHGARCRVEQAPVLIPVYSHRYLPTEPCDAGNPVFSVVQTDIILYGLDLADYLRAEFGVPTQGPLPPVPRFIRFWTEIQWRNDEPA